MSEKKLIPLSIEGIDCPKKKEYFVFCVPSGIDFSVILKQKIKMKSHFFEDNKQKYHLKRCEQIEKMQLLVCDKKTQKIKKREIKKGFFLSKNV